MECTAIHKTENPLLHKAQYTLWSLMSSGRRAKQYVYTFAHTHTTYVYTHMYIYIYYIYTLLCKYIYIYIYTCITYIRDHHHLGGEGGDHQMLGHIYVYIIIYIYIIYVHTHTYTILYHISIAHLDERSTQHLQARVCWHGQFVALWISRQVIAKATAPDHNAIRNASRAECGWADEIGETTEKCGYNPSKDWFKGKSAGNYGIHIVLHHQIFSLHWEAIETIISEWGMDSKMEMEPGMAMQCILIVLW